MADQDVVAELDEWLREWQDDRWPSVHGQAVMQRARDEIVALRRAMPTLADHYVRQARAEALEDAACVCEQIEAELGPKWQDCIPVCQDCAATIRALKDKPS